MTRPPWSIRLSRTHQTAAGKPSTIAAAHPRGRTLRSKSRAASCGYRTTRYHGARPARLSFGWAVGSTTVARAGKFSALTVPSTGPRCPTKSCSSRCGYAVPATRASAAEWLIATNNRH
uniref:(northern house mosquito) hypothetical protein n=1 Tax=Culex pipiens TaxID=7175 RepID=A0A8D8L368_CULPI